ncbi:hypothetical protein [Caproiciproducens sp.]
MDKTSRSEVVKKSKNRIYDTVSVLIRKDDMWNKDFLQDHIDRHNYKSINEFIVKAIHNQIQQDLDNDK